MKRPARVAGLALLLALMPGPALAALTQTHGYHIEIDENFSTMEVEACFDGASPRQLRTGAGNAREWLHQVRITVDGEEQMLRPGRGGIRIPERPDDDCLRYRVDLGHASRSGNIGVAARTGASLVFSPRTWFWRPRGAGSYTRYRLHFEIAEGHDLSGPWPRDEEHEDEHVYLTENDPLAWDASILVGEFERYQLQEGRLSLDVAIADGPGELPPAALLEDWLRRGLAAGREVLGEWPGERAQAVIVPVEGGEDRPLARARASRGGGPGLLLGVDAKHSDAAFLDDGLIVHEFVHLLHPPVHRNARWLTEGLATYYQYIGKARAGQLSEAEAWERFLDGLRRGYVERRQSTLHEISRELGRRGGAEYVYWAGAAIMLLADVELRQREDNPASLDRVLADWAACCRERHSRPQGRDSLEELDELAGGEAIFAPMYDEHVLAVGMPDVESVLEQLGIHRGEDRIELDDDAPLADIRRAIMSPRQD